MDRNEFELLVIRAVKKIPERFREKMDNVAIVIEDEPSPHQLAQRQLGPGWTLLGLYEGVPLGRRSHYTGVLPDKITIFQKPLEQAAGEDGDKLSLLVQDTVRHEIAHHFGMDEGRVRAMERQKRQRKSGGTI